MLPFEYARPETLLEAQQILKKHGSAARILSGGTDLVVGLRHGLISPELVVDLKKVADLPRVIKHNELKTIVGAGVTITEMNANPVIQERYPTLVEAAQAVGSVQIRNRATLVGNICNASPAADTVAVLMIYGASVTVFGETGERIVSLGEFILGPRKIALEPGEIVTGVVLPAPEGQLGTAFARMTRRRGVDLATINLACSVTPAGVTTFAFGAVGPKTIVVSDTTGVLADPEASIASKNPVLDSLLAHATPITDVRASKEYRHAMLGVMSKRILAKAISRLQEQN